MTTAATATAQVETPATAAGPGNQTSGKRLSPPRTAMFYQLAGVLTADEKAIVERVRTYIEIKVRTASRRREAKYGVGDRGDHVHRWWHGRGGSV